MQIYIDQALRAKLFAERNAPKSPETPEALLGDLRKVGPEKPLGYLPVSTIEDLCNTTSEALQAEAAAKGQRSTIIQDGNVNGAALYVWDEQALNKLLHLRNDELVQESWPRTSEAFVHAVGNRKAAFQTPMFDVIADAFGDYASPGRKYIDHSHIPESADRAAYAQEHDAMLLKITANLRKLGLQSTPDDAPAALPDRPAGSRQGRD